MKRSARGTFSFTPLLCLSVLVYLPLLPVCLYLSVFPSLLPRQYLSRREGEVKGDRREAKERQEWRGKTENKSKRREGGRKQKRKTHNGKVISSRGRSDGSEARDPRGTCRRATEPRAVLTSAWWIRLRVFAATGIRRTGRIAAFVHISRHDLWIRFYSRWSGGLTARKWHRYHSKTRMKTNRSKRAPVTQWHKIDAKKIWGKNWQRFGQYRSWERGHAWIKHPERGRA